jgi:hypothetical protein
MILQQGDVIKFSSDATFLEEIPKGNWLLNLDTVSMYLSKLPQFTLPSKIYGDYLTTSKHYLSSFNSLPNSTGVLLSGSSGSGKSLLAKMVCEMSNLPVIIISEYYTGTQFHKVLNEISQDVVIFIDEFEKIYDTHEKQNEFLPILDGVFQNKKLFIFTTNNPSVNKFLLNRPGRVRYHRHFTGLSEELIEEVLSDNVTDVDVKKQISEICLTLGDVSYDALQSILQEVNMYSISPAEAVNLLNIEVQSSHYRVFLIIKGKHYTSSFEGHPVVNEEYSVGYKDDGGWWDKSYIVKLRDFDIYYESGGRVELRHKEETTVLRFEKIVPYKFEL